MGFSRLLQTVISLGRKKIDDERVSKLLVRALASVALVGSQDVSISAKGREGDLVGALGQNLASLVSMATPKKPDESWSVALHRSLSSAVSLLVAASQCDRDAP